jgi:hypothetical protein
VGAGGVITGLVPPPQALRLSKAALVSNAAIRLGRLVDRRMGPLLALPQA